MMVKNQIKVIIEDIGIIKQKTTIMTRKLYSEPAKSVTGSFFPIHDNKKMRPPHLRK